MELIYCGHLDAVSVPLPLGGEVVVERGGVLETSTEHGHALLEQPSNWKKASKSDTKPSHETKDN